MTTVTQDRRPGGRSARVQAAVHRAVADLLTTVGADQVTIPAVATLAGVNPTSIYRRWGDVQRLLADVAMTHLISECPVPDTGNLRDDLVAWAEHVAADVQRPDTIACLRVAVNGDDVRGRCLVERRRQVRVLLANAAARGDAVPADDAIVDHVIGPLYFRVLFGLTPIPADLPRDLVAAVVR